MKEQLTENIARVRERIAAACRRAGRREAEVRLVAVTKTVSAERIRAAYDAGLREFGENRVQEARGKRPALSDLAITWHMIGHLQTNKAKLARELFDWIHSVDSLRLAEKLHQAAPGQSPRLPVLLEVNLGGESSKGGVPEAQALTLAEQVATLSSLEVRGLMAIPPFLEDAEHVRPYFRRLRELAQRIDRMQIPGVALRELSMGMSHDFEVAIEEGATMIRVGTAIFGARP